MYAKLPDFEIYIKSHLPLQVETPADHHHQNLNLVIQTFYQLPIKLHTRSTHRGAYEN